MKTLREILLARVDSYCDRHGISTYALAMAAVGNQHVINTLRRGGSITLQTIERLEAYMTAPPDEQPQPSDEEPPNNGTSLPDWLKLVQGD